MGKNGDLLVAPVEAPDAVDRAIQSGMANVCPTGSFLAVEHRSSVSKAEISLVKSK